MKSAPYFEDRTLTLAALQKYRQFTLEAGWPIGESKYRLYLAAKEAFESDLDEGIRRLNYRTVFGHLRSYWGLARNGVLCSFDDLFNALDGQCVAGSRANGISLHDLAD